MYSDNGHFHKYFKIFCVSGCFENGTCYDVCEYEDIKLMPGHAEPDTGKCIAVFCNEDFVIDVHT